MPASDPHPTVVVTGAAGGVGRLLLPALGGFDVRATDRVDLPGIVSGDLADPAFTAGVTAGADAVVHLAGTPDPGSSWAQLRTPNADVVDTLLAAAVANGVGRVVLASSMHAVGGHVDSGLRSVREDAPAYPCCAYGAAKVFAESLARVYHDQWGLSVVCLRLGGVRDRPVATSWLPGWLSPGDLGRLVVAALRAGVGYGVYHGVSANTGTSWDISLARAQLGYHPVDDSATFAEGLRDDTVTLAPDARPRWGRLHLS